MADAWFEIAAPDHFWIQRRFNVLRALAGSAISNAREIAEIGCGHGLLQFQIEEAYGKQVSGFDLNDFALKQNLSRRSPVYCYDIGQKHPDLLERFDVVFLFDVLEHIDDETAFLASVSHHLAQDGALVINVPAGQWAYSKYDVAAGHVRRYSIRTLRNAIKKNGLEISAWTYWGLPLVPILALRKLWLLGRGSQDQTISSGFDSRTETMNQLLGMVSMCEWMPQKLLGTSLMAVLHRPASAKSRV
jgi:SAM-dependent methyltransferase